MEVCNICGKEFHGAPINVHGSYDFINHTNFSYNMVNHIPSVGQFNMICRYKNFIDNFFKDVSKEECSERLECLKEFAIRDAEFKQMIIREIEIKMGL